MPVSRLLRAASMVRAVANSAWKQGSACEPDGFARGVAHRHCGLGRAAVVRVYAVPAFFVMHTASGYRKIAPVFSRNAPARSITRGPFIASLTLHLVGLVAFLQVDVRPRTVLAFPRRETLILLTPATRPLRRAEGAHIPAAKRPRMPVVAPGPSRNIRPFEPPPRAVPKASAATLVELPSLALDAPRSPSWVASPTHLAVLPAPPLKIDNFAPALTAKIPGNGSIEPPAADALGSGQAHPHLAPPPTIAGFATATLQPMAPQKAASPDPSLAARAGFGDASVSAPAGNGFATRAGAKPAPAIPIEILEKPRPRYSDEARRLHLEGEVLVDTLFPALGPARALRVLRGLGHGLDESAMEAVEAIRFRPSRLAGQAIDSNAIVHVVFQIAY